MSEGARVAVIYGSMTEHEVMARVGAMLARFGVTYDETVISPHRSPRALLDWCAGLEPRGVEVVVAGGGVNLSLARSELCDAGNFCPETGRAAFECG